jgi:SAM-dependent methyltransferase
VTDAVWPLRLYATPRRVDELSKCHWYHSMTLPQSGEVEGVWDLRGHVDDYLGHVEVKGARVLEIGPASGYLTFEMERRGATVVCVELPPGSSFDIVPWENSDPAGIRLQQAEGLRYMQNGFWLAHRELASRSRVYYGDVLHLPKRLGTFDVSVMASVLQHLHDPVGVVMACAERTTDTIVITDLDGSAHSGVTFDEPVLELFPSADRPTPFTWWLLRPRLFEVLFTILGFPETRTTFHEEPHLLDGSMLRSFTVVGRRHAQPVALS